MKRVLFILFLLCVLVANLSCKQEIEEENIDVAEVNISVNSEETSQEETTIPDFLPYQLKIDSLHIASVGFSLGKGEVINGRIHVYYNECIIEILNPYRKVVLDAGRIGGEYEFSLQAKTSGIYIMNIIDDRGSCVVLLEHDYPGTFWNYSR